MTAQVHLFALNGAAITPRLRVLTLDKDHPEFPIGRASKSISKGLQGALNNAWFDSPVMSRDHAKLCLNAEEQSLTIQDIGSMHGTRLNGSQLECNKPAQLQDGDTLIFGAEVKRGTEVFSACCFTINYSFLPTRSVNAYAVPESSDLEDEDDYEFSDVEVMVGNKHNELSSDGALSQNLSPPNASGFIASVDLTRDDSAVDQIHRIVDLTSETQAEKRILDVMHGRPSDIDYHADATSIGLYAGRPPIVIDSEDDESFSSDLQSEFDDDTSGAAVPVTYTSRLINADVTDDDGGSIRDEVEQSIVKDSLEVPLSDDLPMNSIIQYATHTTNNAAIKLFDADLGLESSSNESDNESTIELFQAGAEGMKTMLENGLLCDSDGDDVTRSPDEDLTSSCSMITAQNRTVRRFLGDTLDRPWQIIRQPSPSDAAMMKPTAPAQNSSHSGSCMVGEVGSLSAEKLGNKSGKHTYFEAREANKAKFRREKDKSKDESSADVAYANLMGDDGINELCTTTKFAALGDVTGNTEDTAISTDYIQGLPSLTQVCSMDMSGLELPTRDQCSFLDSPGRIDTLQREVSPTPDMTSAVAYNKSKEILNAVNAVAAHNNRSGIKIKDIIENNISPQMTHGTKRKAANISKVSAKELAEWDTSMSKHTSVAEIRSCLTPDTYQIAQEVAPFGLQSADGQPSKKRKILESIGYISLGAVTAVAGLFAALVATAPEF